MANALDAELDSNGAPRRDRSPRRPRSTRGSGTTTRSRTCATGWPRSSPSSSSRAATSRTDPSRAGPPRRRVIRKKLEKFDEEQRVYNQNRLNRLRNEQGALDVLIMAKTTGLVASASGTAGGAAQAGLARRRSARHDDRVGHVHQRRHAGRAGARVHEPDREPQGPGGRNRDRRLLRALARGPARRSSAGGSSSSCVVRRRRVRRGRLALGASVITRPLKDLLEDIEAVAEGDLGHRTPSQTSDEIGVLASTFDSMTRNLAAAELMRRDLVQKDHEVKIAHEIQERLFPEHAAAAAGAPARGAQPVSPARSRPTSSTCTSSRTAASSCS